MAYEQIDDLHRRHHHSVYVNSSPDAKAQGERVRRRRLPPVPLSPTSPGSDSSSVSSLSPSPTTSSFSLSRAYRRQSRPLPFLPNALMCKTCWTSITSQGVMLTPSVMPPNCRKFKGFAGEATLFTEAYNVILSKPRVTLMATGAHTMQEIACAACQSYLGWKILKALEDEEKWKEGMCLLELELLAGARDTLRPQTSTSDQCSPQRYERGRRRIVWEAEDGDSEYSW